MSDKRPLALDHGASLFHGAKADPRHRAAGKPHGARGASREHVDQQQAPPLPWAVSERAAPHKSDNSGFDVPGAVPAEGAAVKKVMPRGAFHGRSLFSPENAPPRRKVAGKDGLHKHEEERPAELRRAKAKGPHALSNKLQSELEAQRKHSGHAASERKSAASTERKSAKPQHREGPRSTPAERYSETEPLSGLY
jgi:hypothetical protein